MAGERIIRGARRNPGEIGPQNLSPVTKELTVGTVINIEGKPRSQYKVSSYLNSGIVVAKRTQSDPGSQFPEEVVLHSVNPSEAQNVTHLEAIRRIEIPAILGGLGAPVIRPIGYLQTVEDQGGIEQVTGTYTVTEFFGTFNADDRLEAMSGRLPGALVAQTVLDVGKALAIAHSQGIVHRDVKPNNIMVSDNRLEKIDPERPFTALADWEIAYQAGKDPNDFSWGFISPGFSAPEQYSRNTQVVVGSTTRRRELTHDLANIFATTRPTLDIYAFGMTIYNMLGGSDLPKYDEEALAAVVAGRKIAPDHSLIHQDDLDAVLGVGTALNKAVNKATASNPNYRYRSIKEMLLDLRSFFRGMGVDGNSLNRYYASLPESAF